MPTSQCTHRSLGFVAGISLLATYAVIGPSRAISPDVYMPSDFAVDTAKCLKSLVPAVQTTYNSIMEPVDVSVEDVSFVQGLIAKQSRKFVAKVNAVAPNVWAAFDVVCGDHCSSGIASDSFPPYLGPARLRLQHDTLCSCRDSLPQATLDLTTCITEATDALISLSRDTFSPGKVYSCPASCRSFVAFGESTCGANIFAMFLDADTARQLTALIHWVGVTCDPTTLDGLGLACLTPTYETIQTDMSECVDLIKERYESVPYLGALLNPTNGSGFSVALPPIGIPPISVSLAHFGSPWGKKSPPSPPLLPPPDQPPPASPPSPPPPPPPFVRLCETACYVFDTLEDPTCPPVESTYNLAVSFLAEDALAVDGGVCNKV